MRVGGDKVTWMAKMGRKTAIRANVKLPIGSSHWIWPESCISSSGSLIPKQRLKSPFSPSESVVLQPALANWGTYGHPREACLSQAYIQGAVKTDVSKAKIWAQSKLYIMSLATELFLSSTELRVEEVKLWETPNSLSYPLTSSVLLKMQVKLLYTMQELYRAFSFYTL